MAESLKDKTTNELPKVTEGSGAGTEVKSTPRVLSTSLFRVLNPELFVKPNMVVMVIGVVAFSSCVAYVAYWRATGQHKKETYMAVTERGELEKRQRASRWD